MSLPPRPNLLCVANFPANTGFAWSFIESLYAGVATRLAPRGIRTWVAYPALDAAPASLAGSPAEAILHPLDLGSPRSIVETGRLAHELDVGVLYLSDRPSWHPAYSVLRAAGLRRIVVHDHSSGLRTRPLGLRRALKHARQLLPGSRADRVLAVSDFVARRKTEVDLIPPGRVTRIWNSVAVPDTPGSQVDVRRRFDLGPAGPVIACASRATPEKGIHHLLQAFDRLAQAWDRSRPGPWLVYMGDGPSLRELREMLGGLASRDGIRLTGYQDDAADVLGAADVAVVPSVWAEAFGLAALEPMSRGVPVVASRVGGIPEVVRDGVDGLLVPPGDEVALADALGSILTDEDRRARMGADARRRARDTFSREEQLDRLVGVLEAELR